MCSCNSIFKPLKILVVNKSDYQVLLKITAASRDRLDPNLIALFSIIETVTGKMVSLISLLTSQLQYIDNIL